MQIREQSMKKTPPTRQSPIETAVALTIEHWLAANNARWRALDVYSKLERRLVAPGTLPMDLIFVNRRFVSMRPHC